MYALEPPPRTTFASDASIRRLPALPHRRREATGVLASQSGLSHVKRSGPLCLNSNWDVFISHVALFYTESVFRKSYLLLLMFLGRNEVRDKLQVHFVQELQGAFEK
jgi:hypothetical protein